MPSVPQNDTSKHYLYKWTQEEKRTVLPRLHFKLEPYLRPKHSTPRPVKVNRLASLPLKRAFT